MCLTPITIKNKNPRPDDFAHHIVPCGKCPECKKRRAKHWAFRLDQETKVSTSTVFLTLTYADEPLTPSGNPTLIKADFQKFMKKLRHKAEGIKYYMCGEYGSKTMRPHYHAIIFNLPYAMTVNSQYLVDLWQHGHVHFGTGQTASYYYVANYMDKQTPHALMPDQQPQYSAMSKNLGINFLSDQKVKYYKNRLLGYVLSQNGQKISMPRYYKDKLYTKEERKMIAEHYEKLRQEIDISFIDSWNEVQRKKSKIYTHEQKVKLSRNAI